MRPRSRLSTRRSPPLQGAGRRYIAHRRDAEIRGSGDSQDFRHRLGAPVRYMTNVSQSVAAVMKPAGIEKSKGVITAVIGKDPTDPRWKDDAGFKEFSAFAPNIFAG